MEGLTMDNRTIAQTLTKQAHLLESERGNLYRVQAYRRAAETVLGLDEPVEEIVARQGRKGLRELPGIGPHISLAIESLVQTGEFRTVNREHTGKSTRDLCHVSDRAAAAGDDPV
jgi:DNA polymerase/3'-5' exonuclease PolX